MLLLLTSTGQRWRVVHSSSFTRRWNLTINWLLNWKFEMKKKYLVLHKIDFDQYYIMIGWGKGNVLFEFPTLELCINNPDFMYRICVCSQCLYIAILTYFIFTKCPEITLCIDRLHINIYMYYHIVEFLETGTKIFLSQFCICYKNSNFSSCNIIFYS